MVKKITLFLFFLFGGLHLSWAGIVEFKAVSKANTVVAGDRFTVTFSLNTRGEKFVPPTFSGLNILSGPNKSTSMQYVNGKISHSTSYSYIVSARKEGKIEIGSASILVAGKYITSNKLVITVTKGSVPSLTQKQKSGKKSEKLFVNITVANNPIYKGETVVLSQKIYTAINLTKILDFKPTTLNNVWKKDVKLPTQIDLKPVKLGNKSYSVGELSRQIIIPQKSGKFRIPPFSLLCLAQNVDTRFGNSIFDQFFNTSFQKEYRLKSNSITLNVLPLPKNAPKHFSGAVGQYSFKTSIDNTTIDINDALTLKLIVKGSGNIELFKPPSLPVLDQFEVYEPQSKLNSKVNYNSISGSRTIEYLLVPKYAGKFTIPSIIFSYFNPKLKKYVSLSSKSIKVSVTGVKVAGSTHSQTNVVRKESISKVEDDIRFLMHDYSFSQKSEEENFILNYFLLLFPLTIFFTSFFLRKKRLKELENPFFAKRKTADKLVMSMLKTSKSFVELGKKDKFYEEIMRAIWKYLEYKFGINFSELKREKIISILSQNKINVNLITQLIEILDTCERYRYASTSDTNLVMKKHFDKTVYVISKIQKTQKKPIKKPIHV